MDMNFEDVVKLAFMEELERLLAETGEVRNLGAAYTAYLERARESEPNRLGLWCEAGHALAVAANQTA